MYVPKECGDGYVLDLRNSGKCKAVMFSPCMHAFVVSGVDACTSHIVRPRSYVV
jgi:hypothetical protein